MGGERGSDGGRKRRVLQAQVDHGAVDQLHRREMRTTDAHDVLGGIHGAVKIREIHHAQHLGARKRRELQGERARERQRSLAANQQMRQIDRAVGGVGPHVLVAEDIQVVARHATQHFGPMGLDLRPQLGGELLHALTELTLCPLALVEAAQRQQRAIGQPGLCPQHVVHHVAVGDAAAATRVVAGHAPQGGLSTGGHIHRVPQAVGFELCVEMVQHQPGLHRHGALLDVEIDDAAQVFAEVDHQTGTHGLSTLAGAAAARHDGHIQFAADAQGGDHIVVAARHQHRQRQALVDRGVRGVAPAVGQAHQHLALCVALQALGQLSEWLSAAAGQ